MSITTDLANIATALGEVVVPVGSTAIARVYSSPTEKQVTTAEVPCYLVTWRPVGKPELMTFGTYKQTVNYVVSFLYKPTSQGTIADNITAIAPYIQPTMTVFYKHLQLYNTVLGQYPIQISPPIEVPTKWNGQSYLGFELVITVMSQIAVAFGN